MLHMGGPRLQKTYFLLPGAIEDTEPEHKQPYLKCINLLDEFYAPRLNTQHEAYVLRLIEQGPDEKFDEFVQRIRAQVEKCAFQNETEELMTILQILSGVKSNETRRKILEKERTLEEVLTIGRHDEILKENLKSYGTDRGESSTQMVQRVVRAEKSNVNGGGSCFNCGFKGHYASAKECPARGKTCNKCKKVGHFEKVCKGEKRPWNDKKEDEKSERGSGFPNKKVRRMEVVEKEEDRNYMFFLGNKEKLTFVMGNCKMELTVDSGSDITIISGRTWKKLKYSMEFWDQKEVIDQPCFGYEQGQPPIQIVCTIMTKIVFKNREIVEKVIFPFTN